MRPIIGITCDVIEPKPSSLRAACPLTYAKAVHSAGGTPHMLPPLIECIESQLDICDGFVLSGGDDPRTESFGKPTHPKANPIRVERQEYETALLNRLKTRDTPVMGVCLGMQMMALVAGGTLHQHLPESHPDSAAMHWNDTPHIITPTSANRFIEAPGMVHSHHRQSVDHPGALRVLATAIDGVIEAIASHDKRYYIGVQWHPERSGHGPLGLGLFRSLVAAALAD